MSSIGLLFEISYAFDASFILFIYLFLFFFLQNGGDFTDMFQAVYIYIFYAGFVVLICWFGTQLTQHVRQN